MTNEKLYKQFWVICIILFVCIIINFIIAVTGGDNQLRRELNAANGRIHMLEQEVIALNEEVQKGVSAEQGMALNLLEGRISLLERTGAGGNADVDRRMDQMEIKVSTLEKAFKQANGIKTTAKPAAPAKPAAASSKPAAAPSKPAAAAPAKPAAPKAGESIVLEAPVKPPVQIQTGNGAAAPVTPSASAKYHTVEAGETLYRISQQYGLTVEQLRRLNGMREGDVLQIGRKLLVSN